MLKRLLVVAASIAMLAAAAATGAFAGEVKGPPGSPSTAVPGGNPNSTGGLEHANSICAANGLNDFDTLEGQNVFHVQSYGIDVSGHGGVDEQADPHQFNPGDACRGGSGER
jgi:hypothetical protein